jgi:DNA polymerase III sliding clamp (beta) subunit (PCNA family)
MKILLSLKTNIKALKEVITVAKRKKTPDYLAYVQLDCIVDGGHKFVRASSTDLETTITHRLVDCDFDSDSSFSVLVLGEAIAKLLTAYKTIEIHDTKIKAGQAEITHQVLDSKDYPDITKSLEKKGFDDAHVLNDQEIIELKDALSTCVIATGQEESRIRLTGVYVATNSENKQIVCATDGYRLTHYTMDFNANLTALIPRGQIALICEVLNGNFDIRIWSTKNALFIARNDEFILSVQLINEDFPDYKAIIPKDNDYEIKFNQAHIQTIKEALLFAQDKANSPLTIAHQAQGNKFCITLNDASGVSYESKDDGFTSHDRKITFSPKYLLDALQTTPIMLLGTNPLTPALCIEDAGKVKNVVMARRAN